MGLFGVHCTVIQATVHVTPGDGNVNGMSHGNDPATRAKLEPLMYGDLNAAGGDYMIVEREGHTSVYTREDWENGVGQGQPYHLAVRYTVNQ